MAKVVTLNNKVYNVALSPSPITTDEPVFNRKTKKKKNHYATD